MAYTQGKFWNKYIAKVELDLSIAAYTKVPITWNDNEYTPDFYKFYYIIEGEGYVKIGDQLLYPKPGELILLPAGIRQSYGTLSDNTYGKYWCHFTADIGGLPLFQILRVPASIIVKDPERLRDSFEQLIHYANSDELTSEFRVHAILLELIAMFIEQSKQIQWNMSISPSFEKMSSVLRYIDDHLMDHLTIEHLAYIAHFHPNYFIRVFKQFTGSSPIQYINGKRMDKAMDLLTLSDLSVTAIADKLGLELPYFSRMFKVHTGFSPTEYREWVPRPRIGK